MPLMGTSVQIRDEAVSIFGSIAWQARSCSVWLSRRIMGGGEWPESGE